MYIELRRLFKVLISTWHIAFKVYNNLRTKENEQMQKSAVSNSLEYKQRKTPQKD